MRILILDPGTVNFGWSLIESKPKRVIRCGMLNKDHLLKELTGDAKIQAFAFSKKFRALLKKSKPDVIVCERYSTRIRGTTAESVNIMIGIMSISKCSSMHLIMPFTWKSFIKSRLGGAIEDFYPKAKIGKQFNHPIDATLLGFYVMERIYGIKMPVPNSIAKQINIAFIKEPF